MRRLAKVLLSLLVCATAVRAADAAAQTGLSAELTLDDAIRQALAKNYAVRIQSLAVPIARAGVTEAFGKFDPRIDGSYTHGRNATPFLADPFSGIRPPADVAVTDVSGLSLSGLTPWGLSYRIGGTVTKLSDAAASPSLSVTSFAGVQITQPLLADFGTGAALYQLRVARTNQAISEWELRSTLIDTVTQVVYAYSDVLLTEARLRSAQHLLELAEQLEAENRKRFSVGAMSEFDVLSAQARVSALKEGVIASKAAVQATRNVLKQLISDERDPGLLARRISVAPLPDPGVSSVHPAEDFQAALALRPDYRNAVLALQRGELDRRYYRNQLLPRINLVATAGVNGIGSDWPASRADLRSRDYPSTSTGVTVSIPLASAAERGRYRAARLRREQARAYIDKLEQDIVVAVGNAALQLEAARDRVLVDRRARELNQQTLDAELKRLRAGTGSTFAVLYQQEQLGYAEMNEAQADSDYQKAAAEYDRQTGRTLAVHHIAVGTP